MTINISVFFFWGGGGGGVGREQKFFFQSQNISSDMDLNVSMRKEDEFAIDIAQTNKTPPTHRVKYKD